MLKPQLILGLAARLEEGIQQNLVVFFQVNKFYADLIPSSPLHGSEQDVDRRFVPWKRQIQGQFLVSSKILIGGQAYSFAGNVHEDSLCRFSGQDREEDNVRCDGDAGHVSAVRHRQHVVGFSRKNTMIEHAYEVALSIGQSIIGLRLMPSHRRGRQSGGESQESLITSKAVSRLTSRLTGQLGLHHVQQSLNHERLLQNLPCSQQFGNTACWFLACRS
jgi:hypothetical protein